MPDSKNNKTSAPNGFGQRAPDRAHSYNAAPKAKKPSLIRRDQSNFDFELPTLSKSTWLALAIVPAPFLVPFLWPDGPGSFNAGLNATAAPTEAPRLSVIPVKAADAEMDAAISRARSGLSAFLDKSEDPADGERGFALKVALPTRAGSLEHIWTANFMRIGAKFQGQVINTPVDIPGIRAGSTIEFDEHQISDWMYRRDGRIVGNETIRPLLKAMPESQAARYRAMLADR